MGRPRPEGLSESQARQTSVDPVPLEYSIAWLTCAVACGLDAVMVGWPGAAQDRLLCLFAGYSAAPSWCSAGTWPRMLSCWCSGTRRRRCAVTPTGVRYQPADRVWFTTLAQLISRRRRAGVFPPSPAPVGAGNCVTSCDLGIFVDQAAEPVAAHNAHIGQLGV